MDSYLMEASETRHNDLRTEAMKAYNDGSEFQVILLGPVETLIIGKRAGQAAGGDASWGDWDAEEETIRMDSGEHVDLYGKEVAA